MTLRVSSDQPPQEPTPEPANHDLLYLGIATLIICGTIVIIGRKYT